MTTSQFIQNPLLQHSVENQASDPVLPGRLTAPPRPSASILSAAARGVVKQAVSGAHLVASHSRAAAAGAAATVSTLSANAETAVLAAREKIELVKAEKIRSIDQSRAELGPIPKAASWDEAEAWRLCAAASADVYHPRHVLSSEEPSFLHGGATWLEEQAAVSIPLGNPTPEFVAVKYLVRRGGYKGKTILAFRGTHNRNQVLQDLHLAAGGGRRIRRVVSQALEAHREHDPDWVTGHSLGGMLAEIVASHTGSPGVAFAPPGPVLDRTNLANGDRHACRPFKVVVHRKDFIAQACQRIPVGKEGGYGNSHIVEARDIHWLPYDERRDGMNPATIHKMKKYIELLGPIEQEEPSPKFDSVSRGVGNWGKDGT